MHWAIYGDQQWLDLARLWGIWGLERKVGGVGCRARNSGAEGMLLIYLFWGAYDLGCRLGMLGIMIRVLGF